jgi:hypothetical protein
VKEVGLPDVDLAGDGLGDDRRPALLQQLDHAFLGGDGFRYAIINFVNV